jgi:hypothetical protein
VDNYNTQLNRPFAGYTLGDLQGRVDAGNGTPQMVAEIARREAVAVGDFSKMTPGERLRAARRG